MALAIGFANKFYTLWDVSSENNYSTTPNGQHYLSSVTTRYTYYQNLSMIEAQAIEKAKERGCKNLIPDEELRGRHSSWECIKRFKPTYEAHQFTRGKYEGRSILECTDINYLKWYFNEYREELVAERVCELDNSYKFVDGDLWSASELMSRDILDSIYEGGREVVAVSNFQYEEGSDYMFVSIEFDPKTDDERRFLEGCRFGIKLELKFDFSLDLQSRFYQGYTYYVPKGVRSFKKTTFTLVEGKIVIK